MNAAAIRTLLPGLPVALPLMGAAITASCRKLVSRRVVDAVCIFFAAVDLAVCFVLLRASASATIVHWFGNWYPRGSAVLGIGFVIDPVAAGLASLAAVLFFLAFVFSWRFVHAGNNHFHPLMLVFMAAMQGFVLTGDLFNMFVFFELMSTAAFALCGLETGEPAPLQGAFNFAVTNTIAAFLGLTGIALLYAVTGALNMAQIGLQLGARHDPLVLFAFTLLSCGFLVKAAVVPFHFWLPDAHAVAPTAVCALFSGLMVELGLYAILRLHTVVFAGVMAAHPEALRNILMSFAVLTVAVGALMCYAEHHIKRMLAFSTVCHGGLMLACYACGGPEGISAVFLYLLAHSFAKAGLFFLAGIIFHRLRTLSEAANFAHGRPMRWTAALWFLGGAVLAGAPPLGLMFGEAASSTAAEHAHLHHLALLFWIGGMMTAAAVFRVGIHTFLGWGDFPLTDEAATVEERPEISEDDRRIFPYHFLPAAFCVVAASVIWLVPGAAASVAGAASRFAFQPGYLHAVYTRQTVFPPAAALPTHSVLLRSSLRGASALLAAVALAFTSVFRRRLAQTLRLGSALERGIPALRDLQSGHPGDYVAWLTVGVACFGAASFFFLRR